MAAFAEVDEDEIQKLMAEKDAKQTKRTVERSINSFRVKGVAPNFESFTKSDLNEHLRSYYASARKQDGTLMKKIHWYR